MESFNDFIRSGQLVLVDFYATWCGPCKTMHPILDILKQEMGEGLRIIKMDIDKNEPLTTRYRVQSVPTLLLFKGGEVVWRQSGALPLSTLKDIIRQHQKS